MIVWMMVGAGALVGGLLLWRLLSQPKSSEEKPVRFVCKECGETHCNCYREDETS